MRRQALKWILPVCLLVAGSPLAAQSYQKLWKETEAYQKKDMPESVIRTADKIYRKAEKERNFPQMLSAFNVRMNARGSVSSDSLYVDLARLEQWAAQEKNPVRKSLLYMMVGNACSERAWGAARSSKKVEQARPENYAEWTADMFRERMEEADSMSLQPMDELGRTNIKGYEILVDKGEESAYFDHDLLSLVMHNMLDNRLRYIQQTLLNMDKVIAYYENKKRTDAALLFKSDRIFFQQKSKEEKLKELKTLVEEYKGSPLVPYIYERILDVTVDVKDCYALCRYVIESYPSYKRVNIFKNKLNEITAPQVSVVLENGPVPHQRIPLNVNVRSVDELTVALYHAGTDEQVQQRVFSLHNPNPYELKDTVVYMDALPAPGKYMLEASYGKEEKKKRFEVNYTSLLPVGNMFGGGGGCRMYVLDRETGHPIGDANVEFFTVDYNRSKRIFISVHTQTTDHNGELYWKAKRNADLYACISKEGCGRTDTLRIGNALWGSGADEDDKETETYTRVYTDRGIYRPGQTVQLSGIMYWQNADNAQVVAGRKVELTVLNSNQEKIGSLQLTTNKMGTFSGSISLPEKGVLGNVDVVDGNGDYLASFRIEEYKRPAFEVSFLPVKTIFGLNDSVRLEGKAMNYSGTPVRNAVVAYTIARSYSSWIRNNGSRTLTGTVSTDENGRFSIPVYLEVDKNEIPERSSWWRASFRVEASVTSAAGETQVGEKSLYAGLQPLDIAVDMPAVLLKEKRDSVLVKVQNNDGQPIQTDGRYDVFRMKKNAEGNDVKSDSLIGGTFSSQHKFMLPVESLPSGRYLIRYSVKTDDGKNASKEQETVIFSANDSRSPVDDVLWSYFPNDSYDSVMPATFYIATSAKDAYLIYNVFNQKKLVESKRYYLTDSLMTFTIKDSPGYEKGVSVQWYVVKNGKSYRVERYFRKEMPDRGLVMKWETFRDRLTPGQSEEWKLKIMMPNGKPADAELLAGMYDASLDRYAPNYWWMNLSLGYNSPYIAAIRWNAGRKGLYLSQRIAGKPVPEWRYDSWIPELGIGGIALNEVRVMGYSPRRKVAMVGADVSGSEVSAMQSRSSLKLNEEVVKFTAPMVAEDATESAVAPQGEESTVAPQGGGLRSNFNETAFFYPHIQTDKNGIATISFTLPQSITTWNFLGLAHTKNMYYCSMRSTVVASKEFMLQQQLPRFVRVGDKMKLAATVDNRSKKVVTGVVRMELFDPMDNKVYASEKKNFSVKAEGSVAVAFDVTVKEANLLACRMVAEGAGFSDGEQRYLPVLSDKEWITESQTLTANGAGHFETDLRNLFNHQSSTATRRRFTVEYTNNPAWLAVMALPSMANPRQNDVLSLSAAYYSTCLGGWIAAQNPRIKEVCDAWKAQEGTGETLWSQLQKNEELKNIVLEETPWLQDAKGEADQRRMISTLFDVNALQSKASYYLQRLTELQRADGSWCWFKGMRGSRFMTNQVVETLLRLNKLTEGKYQEEILPLVNKGMDFLAWSLEEEFGWMKKEKNVHDVMPSEMALHFLYLYSMNPTKLNKEQTAAYNYCLDMFARSSGKLTVLGKAVGAQVLAKAGKKKSSEDFVRSMLEYSVYRKDLGRYYDADIARYSWSDYRIPTQAMVIEACHATGVQDSIVNQYAQWILRQKQVQAWSNPMNSVNAVYALLSSDKGLLDATPAARLTIDGTPVIPDAADATLGYVKQTTVLKDSEKAPQTFTVEKTDNHMGWGAVYAQYLEDLSKVGRQSGELSIKRTLLVARNVNGEEVWQELKGGESFHVGDRILSRLTVSNDRDMDFVMIEDKIAACMEPGVARSGYDWSTGYSKTVKDTSTRYFADKLRKGVHMLDTEYTLTHIGTFRLGIATIQSAYAPEMNAHSEAGVLEVK